MSRVVPESWMPDCRMKGIITHWSAGGYHATELDREHYHLCIEGDGNLVRGEHSIADNVRTGDGDYAAHTRGCNTGYIGVSVMCMGGAIESPFYAGRYPMTMVQWDVMVRVVADLCLRYRIPVTPETVLGHGEVERILGKPQRGKWDPLKLPWNPGLSRVEVGDSFRNSVRGAIGLPQRLELPGTTHTNLVRIDGEELEEECFLKNGMAWVPLRPLAERLGVSIRILTHDQVSLVRDGELFTLPFENRGGRGYVPARSFAERCGCQVAYDAAARTVTFSR